MPAAYSQPAIGGIEVWLFGDQANRAAHGASTVQSSLRPAQHLDALDVDDSRIDRIRHRRLVDVESGRPVARDAANGYGPCRAATVAGVGERQIGHLPAVVEEAIDCFLFQIACVNGGSGTR